MRHVLTAVAVLLLLCCGALARRQAEPPAPLDVALDHLHNLEYDSALATLRTYLETHPDDLRGRNLLAGALLRQEMFRQGLLEIGVYGDEGDVYKPEKLPLPQGFDEQLTAALDQAQQLADQRLKTDPKDLDALYWAGVTHGTRAMYLFTLRRSYMGALGESKAAYRIHRKLLELDPQNADALLVIGTQDYVVGNLPWPVKLLARLAGASGNKQRGIEEVQRCAAQGHYARADARFVLPVLYMREKHPAEALPVLQSLAADYPRNYLLLQEIAAVYRFQHDWRAALDAYNLMFARHREGAPGYANLPLPRLLYLAGQTASRLDEKNLALNYYAQAQQHGANDVYGTRAERAAAELREGK